MLSMPIKYFKESKWSKMEFFIFLIVAMQMFIIPAQKLVNGQLIGMTGLRLMPVYAGYIIATSLYIVVYILKGIGLYTMAKKAGYSKIAIFSFIPFLNTLMIGRLCGKSKLMNIDIKWIAIIAMSIELLYAISMLINTTASNLAISNGAMVVSGNQLVINNYTLDRMIFTTNILNNWILSFLYSFSTVALYTVFMRLYSPRNALLIVLLNIFIPILWIFIFTCRNVDPRTANAYSQNIYVQNQYTRQNTNSYNAPPSTPNMDDPFAEYKGNSPKDIDPFAENTSFQQERNPFDDNDKK